MLTHPGALQALHAAEQDIEHLQTALAVAEEAAVPSVRAFISLERRIANMAAALNESEAKWQNMLSEDRRKAAAELRVARERNRAELAFKDAIIEGFRGEIEGLLAAARALQLPSR